MARTLHVATIEAGLDLWLKRRARRAGPPRASRTALHELLRAPLRRVVVPLSRPRL
ncbi:MAG: hypothetical protein IT372_15400 [Polyangiaceae bacterium]|nr:hypothetical protein [Polyangiaceae bacterium]